MNNPATSGILWNKAAKNGIILGMFTAACRILTQTLAMSEASVGTALVNGLIWIVQFAGCILLMRFFMQRLVLQHDGTDNRTTARYGIMLALTSAVIFSAAMLFDIMFITPELVDRQMDLYYQLYGPHLDSNTRDVLDRMEGIYPQIMFFSTLIYSFLYGTVLSLVLSRYIPKKDPFSSFMKNNGE